MPNHRVPTVVRPTQVARPWRTTARSVLQLVIALCSLIPLVVSGVYGSADDAPAAVAQVVLIMTTVTRVMAMPVVEQFLRRFVPWLAADPDPTRVTVVAQAEPIAVEDAARGERGESLAVVVFTAAFLGALVAVLLLRLL